MNNIDDFVTAVKGESHREDIAKKQIHAGLIDNYVAGYYKTKLLVGLEVPKVFEYTYSYSFLTDGILQDQQMTGCLRKHLSEMKEDDILGEVKSFKVSIYQETVAKEFISSSKHTFPNDNYW